jgi:hypothetical protein
VEQSALRLAEVITRLVPGSAVSPADIGDALHARGQTIRLSPGLRGWYAQAAPRDVQIPWFAEELTLYDPASLVEWQVGYRWDTRGNVVPDWGPSWVVIGDWSADPIIAEVNQPGTPVSYAIHGIGTWAPWRIAPTLDVFLEAMATWVEVSLGHFQGQLLDDNCEVRSNVRAAIVNALEPVLGGPVNPFWFGQDE